MVNSIEDGRIIDPALSEKKIPARQPIDAV
jgi:hypothetical protein